MLYFADFDLAGILIYQKEFQNISSIELFIPKNIENIIKQYGSKKLFDEQYSLNQYKNLTSSNTQIDRLVKIIKREQKALEQEYFIKGKN